MIESAMGALRQLTRETASSLRSLSAGGYVLLGVLGALLIAAAAMAWLGWESAPDTDVPGVGYVTLAIGVGFSLVVGAGLMALVFYSSRSGYDEPARLVEQASQETAPDRDRA
ncbi:hypothetical protein GA0061099_100440 [Bradyrhizobium yuanmingense]|uniref:Uncharacterized protein n=1 Tax=Bradyrhizobium yuanmingense TaxID=108015 RepID=A0A1C3VI71_9BRAD|nr:MULTISPECIES: hypothetical protein [Bradyrhizobium]TWI28454.1 hypothetical protein IQ15_01799 [Bradyrhizobium yuanmingense]SCB27540.1 hypothetical protein GA0061099_100440 [Bradyrhizobium yuanmingense]